MSVKEYLNTSVLHEIILYPQKDLTNIHQQGRPFSGTPRKHPYDPEKMILIPDPVSVNTCMYEFRLCDIIAAEDQPSIITERGENIQIVRIWVKRGSFGLKAEPFTVEN